MRTESIRFVREVYRTGNMASAARNLNITPQGLGKAVQKLEDELGVRLFVRSADGATPTPICEQIYEKLTEIVDAENSVREIIAQTISDSHEEEVFLVNITTIGMYVEEGIREYNRKHQDKIRILEMTLRDELQDQSFYSNKYAYRYISKEAVPNSPLLKEEIVRLRFVLIAGNKSPLTGRASVTYKDLSEQTLLVEDLDAPHVQILLNKFDTLGLKRPQLKLGTYVKEVIKKRLDENPEYVYFARERDKEVIRQYTILNFETPFYITMCLETHRKTMNKDLLKELQAKLKNYND